MAENTKKVNINKIRKTIEENREHIEQSSKEIKGYGRVISKIIDPTTKEINFDNISVSSAKSISSNLFNMKGKDKGSDYQISQLLYSQMSGMNDISQDALEDLISSNRHSYKEYDILVKEMSEIGRALDLMASDVVFPNAVGKTGLKVEFKNNNENINGERYSDLIKYLRPLEDISLTLSAKRLYSFNLEKEVMDRIKSTMKYGATMVVTIPYSNIANDLLYDSFKRKEILGESYTPNKESFFYVDDPEKDILNRLQAAYEHKQKNGVEATKNAMGESYNYSMSKLINSSESTYGYDLLDYSFYTQGDVDEVANAIRTAIKEDSSILSNNENYVSPYSGSSDIYSLISRGEAVVNPEDDVTFTENEFAKLEELKEKRKLKFNIDKIKGCTSDVLDLKRTLPLFIKNELMGVMVIKEENEFSNQRMGTSLKMLLTPDQTEMYSLSNVNSATKDKMRTIILDDMSKTLRRNISKKLLRNNPTLIEDIEYILDEEDIESLLKTRVRFIPAEYITFYKTGNGLMGESYVEKSKMYIKASIDLIKNYLLNKIFLDKAQFLFKIPHSNDASVATMVRNSIKLFRSSMPTFEHLANSDVINNTLAARSTLIIPQLPSGQDLFTIEKMEQLKPEPIDQEFLDKLRNNATAPFGYPADVLDPNTNVDFAKKIAQINITTAMTVMTLQNEMTIPVSEECTRRIRYLTGNHKLECIVTFDPPRELMDNTMSEIINQTNTISEIYEKVIEEDTSIEDENKELAKYFIREELLKGLIDLSLIEDVKERYSIEGSPSTEDIES